MQPGYPQQVPHGPRPSSGNPVGAFFLGFLASVVVSLVYGGIVYATYRDQSQNTVHALYVLHALLNGAVVGALVGLVAHRRTGAHVSGAAVAVLGTFFGYTNAVVFVTLDAGGLYAFRDMMQGDAFIPAKAWWGNGGGGRLVSLAGLVIAAATAWGLAHLVGRNRR
ncbi:hypothetical protein AR457_09595 [Streptomyces agglomeratus]|nr:hypothetical protein BGK70_27070 [Streptomyces agglomeratus]OEJ44317.1 hypothetical protein AR457_09595 [Streptomyces agglomeratus]OEJ61177.1 hypothetical protein BGM19_27305 [Streptomyces agglomeratus]